MASLNAQKFVYQVRELGFFGLGEEEDEKEHSDSMLLESDIKEMIEENPKLAYLFEYIQNNPDKMVAQKDEELCKS